jgi:septal ring factor EnvC (AmiA/AmiB activator)
MVKNLLLAAVLALAGTSVAAAQDAPKNADDCFQMSMDLFKSADAGKLSDDKRSKVEEMLEKLETHCDAKQFAEAAAVAKDVKSAISGN